MSTITQRLRERPQVATAAIVGAVVTLVGLIGPLTGSEGTIVIFARNYLHDVIHVVTGGLGVAAAFFTSGRYAGTYNQAMGIVYLLIFVLGLVFFETFAELINLNMADNVLHLFLGITIAGVGFGVDRR